MIRRKSGRSSFFFYIQVRSYYPQIVLNINLSPTNHVSSDIYYSLIDRHIDQYQYRCQSTCRHWISRETYIHFCPSWSCCMMTQTFSVDHMSAILDTCSSWRILRLKFIKSNFGSADFRCQIILPHITLNGKASLMLELSLCLSCQHIS